MERKQNTDTLATTDASRTLNITTQTLHNWRKRGYIAAVQLPNGRYRIPLSEVERLLTPKQVS